MAGLSGRVTRVLIEPEPGREAQLQRALIARYGAKLNPRPVDTEAHLLAGVAFAERQVTLLFSVIALVAGIVLAYNALLLASAERRRFILELVKEGAPDSMVIGSLAFDATVLGLAGCVIAGIARRRDFPREKRTTWSQTPAVLGRALPAIALPGILLGLIYSGITTPTEAAAIAATYALLLALIVYRTLSLSQLLAVISDTVRATAMIALIMSGAFVFNYAVANEGVPQLIQSTLLRWKSIANGVSALRRSFDAAARRGARRSDDPAGDRAATGADRARAQH